jgi:hypothetical protein
MTDAARDALVTLTEACLTLNESVRKLALAVEALNARIALQDAEDKAEGAE